MRRTLCSFAIVLFLPALGFAQNTTGQTKTNWRPSGRHSTLDRSEFVQPFDSSESSNDVEELPGESRPIHRQSPVIQQQSYAEPDTVLQTAQSPEAGTIESPLGPDPLFESYFPPGVDPNEPCPECFDEPRGWITRKSTALAATWLPAGDNEIGWTDFDLRTKLAFPALENLTVQPGIQIHFIDGPTRTDLPEKIYNYQIEFRWKQQVSRPFWYEVAVTPGFYSDYQRSNSEAFRLKAQGLLFFAFSYETQVVAGLYYLDRFDIDFLPIVGVIHSPREDIKLNLVFPAPKIAKRVSQRGWNEEWWVYISGEFGGGSWAIERNPGIPPGGRREDQIAYRDWRLILGLERIIGESGRTMFLEAGYVFSRELEYESGRGDFDPSDTAMLRAGVSY